MLSGKFERTRRKHPAWSDRLRRVQDAFGTVHPGQAVDPAIVASSTGLKLGEVVGLLKALAEESVGRFQLRVVDEHGIEVASFASLSEIPPTVEDEFGREVTPEPENVELVFRVGGE